MIIRDSIPVLLEMARVDYQLNGRITPTVSFVMAGEEPRRTENVAEFYEKQFNDKRLLEYAVTNENVDSVFIIYAGGGKCLEYVANKELLESAFLGPWIRTELLEARLRPSFRTEVKGKEIMIPSKNDIVAQVAETLQKKDWSKQAVKVMKKSSDAVLARVQQGITTQIQEDTAPIIQQFVVNLSKSLMDATVNFLEKNKDASVDLPVFPMGTRYIKQDGQILNVVIEQQPTSRTLLFTKAAVEILANPGKEVQSQGGTSTHHLALPYTVFVLQFVGNQFNSFSVYFRSTPLSSVTDELAKCPFPNISDPGSVCMGDFRVNSNKKIDEQCDELITGFWSTVFGHDHIQRFGKWLTLNNMTLWQYQQKSKDNSLCALKFKLQPANVKLNQTFRTDGTNNLVAMLKQHILTAVGQIGGEVQKLLVDLDITGENREKVHVETMSEIVKEIILQAYAELWEQLAKKLDSERQADALKNQQTKDRMKQEFMEWVRQSYPQLQKQTW